MLDGRVDDAVWALAPPGGTFTQKSPQDGAPSSEATTVRVLYDDDAVYVGFDCPQTHTPITRRLTRRDRVVEADAVTIDLGTRGDRASAFEFYVSASGTLADAVRFNDTESSPDWDENWDARTAVGPRGWSAEFRIPLRSLRFPSLPLQSWDFQASRYISHRQEFDYWSYYPRSAAGEVSHYGFLDGLRDLGQKNPLELRPFVVGRVRRRDPGQGTIASGWDRGATAGGDLKWHVKQDLTLDATVNPDFAQVEADNVVLNLSTIETYYPEKRAFFVEGLDALTTPFQLLYTRRIGHVPPTPSLRTGRPQGEKLVDTPDPSAIYAATKLTGRLAGGWSIATVQAVTAPNDVEVQLEDGTRATRRVDPTTAFGAVRLKYEIGRHAHVAIMGTAATHAESTQSYPLLPPGDGAAGPRELCPIPTQLTPLRAMDLRLAPGARCFNDAYVGAVDWRWRSPDGDYSFAGQVAGSVLENGPTRPVADGTRLRPGDLGWGAKSTLSKDGGRHWVGSVALGAASPRFEVNDVGYNERANSFTAAALLEHRELAPGDLALENHVQLNYGTTYDWKGLMVGQGLYLSDFGKLRNFWTYYLDVHYRGTKYDDREVGDGTALQRAGRVGAELSVGTDPTKRVALRFVQTADALYNGFNVAGNLTLTVRPLAQMDIDLLPIWSWTAGEPRFVGPGARDGEYVFARLDARSLGITARATYTFTPRLTLQAYAQLFLAAGHYDDYTSYRYPESSPREAVDLARLTPYGGRLPSNPDFESGIANVNVVLRWEYALGSTFYLVYSHTQAPDTVLGAADAAKLNLSAIGHAPATDVLLGKLSFWWGG